MPENTIRIGGASGYWGESPMATPQLLAAGGLDYIVYDYLAEITMSILARARARDATLGYATDFVSDVVAPNLQEIARQGVKLISNAGGVNPVACGAAIRELVQDAGLDLKVAVLTGDDLYPQVSSMAAEGLTEMYSGDPFPEPGSVASMNAYLGAFPIAEALRLQADIVIVGRCVDSAVTLGACINAFGWSAQDWDRLAAGSLAGHILECGPQATGGNFTDWHLVADTIHNIGYPIAEISADGSFSVTKPEHTGGIVNVGTISEQMMYEIGDPQAYALPDVVCDFSQVEITALEPGKVHVKGAKGYPAPDAFKVSATYHDGFRGGNLLTFYGIDADKKAKAFADAVLTRADKTLQARGMAAFTETSVEIIGNESQFGGARQIEGSREVAVKIAAKHPDQQGIGILLRETSGLGLATPPGLSGFAGGRSKPSPVIRLFSFLISRQSLSVEIDVDGKTVHSAPPSDQSQETAPLVRPAVPAPPQFDGAAVEVPLVDLAWGRSGDKGNKANIGIIARKPEYLPYIWAALSEDAVAQRLAHFIEERQEGSVERFFLPSPNAINFLLHEVLGGGGVASLRNDAQGKGYAQLLLTHPIPVSRAIAENLP